MYMFSADYASSQSSEGGASFVPMGTDESCRSSSVSSSSASELTSASTVHHPNNSVIQERMMERGMCAPVCTACGLKAVVYQTAFCSRRCSWSAEGKCPQCGRYRDLAHPYCSPVCCQQALQANWCPCCGISQIDSAGSCTNRQCFGSTIVICGETKRQRYRMQHQILPLNDPVRGTLTGPLNQGFAAGFGHSVLSIIKINGAQSAKKRYLAHRSTVEATLSSFGIPKYGHGGEGNEQRKFMPMSLRCGLGTVADGSNGNQLQCCNNPQCDVCRTLNSGLRLGDNGSASHYCTTSAPQSMCWCEPNLAGCRAVLVARVVVGNPELVVIDNESGTAPQISLPENPDMVHCTVLTNQDQSQDGLYLFRDDSIDPLYIVVFA